MCVCVCVRYSAFESDRQRERVEILQSQNQGRLEKLSSELFLPVKRCAHLKSAAMTADENEPVSPIVVNDDSISNKNFDYGYDSDEPPPMVKNKRDKLLWRQDPIESVSDWTIEITYNVTTENSNARKSTIRQTLQSSSSSSTGGTNTTTPAAVSVDNTSKATTSASTASSTTRRKTDVYHVHKCILSASPRKSEYFSRLFQHDRRPTKKKSPTKTVVDDENDSKNNARGQGDGAGGSSNGAGAGAGGFIELQTNTSCIELEELAAIAFPYMLDYIYSMDHVLDVTTQTATALYYLGGYFELRSLRWDAKQFWLRDMDSTTCGTYYEHSKILQQERIQQAAVLKCAQYVMNINERSRLLHVPNNDEFWLSLLEANHPSNGNNMSINNIENRHNNNDSPLSPAVAAAVLNESIHNDDHDSVDENLEQQHHAFSLHVSKLLSHYFVNCGGIKENFEALTQKEYLPKIHHDAALRLLEAERLIANPNATNHDTATLTCLQQRCIDALAENWTCFATNPPAEGESRVRAQSTNDPSDAMASWQAKLLQHQNPLIVTQLLLQVTQVAYKNLQDTRQQSQDAIHTERQRFVRAPIGSDFRNPDYWHRGTVVRLPQPNIETMQDGLIMAHRGNMYGVYYYDPNHTSERSNNNNHDNLPGGDNNNNLHRLQPQLALPQLHMPDINEANNNNGEDSD